ncbi:FAXDC2 [Symbiodinium microadriaticum]|nr:FAXDC2 [Symbiodinium microadriaticum]
MDIELLWLKEVWGQCLEVVQHKCGNYTGIVLFVAATQLLHLFTFWAHCIPLAIIDLNPEYFKWCSRWKTQQGVHVSREKYQRAIEVALFNQFAVNIPYSICAYFLFEWRGFNYGLDTFPTVSRILLDFVGFVVVEEVAFYYGHLWMHLPQYYGPYHKQHHEFTAPVGVACIYAHPIEHILCNLSPIVLGPFLLRSHLITYWIWLTFAVFSTITSHSGYHFPFIPSSERHDYHHLKFNVNYGPTGALDHLNSTDKMFRHTQQEAR